MYGYGKRRSNNNTLIPIPIRSNPITVISNKGNGGDGVGVGVGVGVGDGPKMEQIKFVRWYTEMCKMPHQEFFNIEFLDRNKKWDKILVRQKPKDRNLAVCHICDMVLKISPRTITEHCCGKRHRQHLNQKAYDFRITNSIIDLEKTTQIINLCETKKPEISKTEIAVSNLMHKIIDSKEDNTQKVFEIMQKLLNGIHLMRLNDLEKIEFKCSDTEWKTLFIRIDNRYNCLLCNTNPFSNLVELRYHLLHPEHKENMKKVKGLFHPIIAPIKELNYQENKISLKDENSEGSLIVKNPFASQQINSRINPFGKLMINENERANQSSLEISLIATDSNITKENDDNEINSENDSQKNNTILTKLIVNSSKKTNDKKADNEFTKPFVEKLRNTKVNDKEFREMIENLEIGQITKIEFYKNNTWRKMVQWIPKFFACKLCSVQQISTFKILQEHLRGKNHKTKMMSVEKFYHPKLTLEQKNIEESTENFRQMDTNAGTIKITINSTVSNLMEIDKELKVPENEEENWIEEEDVIITDIQAETITLEDSPEREIPELRTFGIAKERNKISTRQKQNDAPSLNHSKRHSVASNQNFTLTKNNQSSTDLLPSFSTKTYFYVNDSEVEGFIGIEYVVKILRHCSSAPRFECCLCEHELDGFDMQNHLKSSVHRIKYLERHFPTFWKSFRQYRNDIVVIGLITEKIAIAIEKYHGRDLPYERSESEFRSNRQEIMSKVYSFRHASELSGPSFTNIIDKHTLENILKNKFKYGENANKRLQSAQSENIENLVRPSFTQRNENQQTYPFITESIITPQQPIQIPTIPIIQSYGRNAPLIQPVVPENQSNSNSFSSMFVQQQVPLNQGFFRSTDYMIQQQIQNQTYQSSITQSFQPINQILDDDEHKRLAERFIQNTKLQDRHSLNHSPIRSRSHSKRDNTPNRKRSRSPLRRKRTPSKSPLRDDDVWQAYRRKFDYDVEILNMDFKSYRKDPQSYPFYKEEWQKFWSKKVAELKTEGIDHQDYNFTPEWKKFFLHRLEDIHETDIEDLKVRLRERFVLPMHNKELMRSKYQKYRLKEIYAGDIEAELKAPLPPSITTQSNSSSPFSTNSTDKTIDSEKIITSSDSEKEDVYLHGKQNTKYVNEDDKINDEVTIISVLRLLTVLEDNLGSLGPKVIELLTKALTLEKIKTNASEELLLITDNCAFLETCKEKLKCQIAADCIPELKLRAVRLAITDIANLMVLANKKRLKNTGLGIVKTKKKTSRIQLKPVKKCTQNEGRFIFNQDKNTPSTSKSIICTQQNKGSFIFNQDKNTPYTSKSIVGTQQNKGSFIFTQDKNTPSTSKSIVCTEAENFEQNSVTASSPSIQHNNIDEAFSMTQTDKKELAQKLTTVLMDMGKSDISAELCEELVEVYQVIGQKKISTGEVDIQKNCLSTKLLKMIGDLQKKQQSLQETEAIEQQEYSNRESQINQPYQLSQNNNSYGNLANFDTSLNINSSYMNRIGRITNSVPSTLDNSSITLSSNYQVSSISNQHLRNAMQALQTINNSNQPVPVHGPTRINSDSNVYSNTNTLLFNTNLNPGNNTSNYKASNNSANDGNHQYNYEMSFQQNQLWESNQNTSTNNFHNFNNIGNDYGRRNTINVNNNGRNNGRKKRNNNYGISNRGNGRDNINLTDNNNSNQNPIQPFHFT